MVEVARVQSLIIEINRWLYLGKDFSVDSQRIKTLFSFLRRVGEVVENNEFFNDCGQNRKGILFVWLSAMER